MTTYEKRKGCANLLISEDVSIVASPLCHSQETFVSCVWFCANLCV